MRKLILSALLLVAAYSNLYANITQGKWRWRNNDGNEKTATWRAGTDTAITITDYKAIRLRAEIYNSTTDVKTTGRSLQYSTSPNGPWSTISNASAINAFNYAGDNSFVTNNEPTTLQLIDSTYAFVPSSVITSGDLFTDTIIASHRREYEWCIKPTSNIRANTTYYFKSEAGADDSPLPSLTASGSAFTSTPAPIVTNGGFENNLTGWTTAKGSGSASFNVTTTNLQFHNGAKALAVAVTNKSTSNSVNITSGSIALSDTGTYLLRFWAIASSRNAQLDLNIKGATTSSLCHYQIYNRFDATKNGWQMYQYAFKVTESPVNIVMNFNSNATYYLDDIEIVSSTTNPEMDVKNQYNWQNNFNESYGWLSGDNNNPVMLPDNRIAWVYNDSFMGVNNPHSNVLSSSKIINNLVVVQDGTQLKSIYKGTSSNAQALFSPGNGHLFWQSGAVVEDNKLKILLIEINGGNYAGHSWIGTLSLPDLTTQSLVQLPATINVNPNCVFQDGDYNYLYFGASSATNEVHTIVARVPKGQLDSQTAWQYYTNSNTWSTDYSNAKNLVEGTSAGNVIKIGPNNYAMSGVPNLANEIDVWFASSPTGPWINKTIVYNIPSQEGILAYEGHMVANGTHGDYTFSYSVYPFVNEPNGSSGSVAMQIAVKSTYVPIYAKANLLQLSPFTSRPATTDTLTSFAGTYSNHAITLKWTSAQKDDNHYDVQRSEDGVNFSTLTTKAGSDSTTLSNYQFVDNRPVEGVNYYRLAIYDVDSKLTYSPIIRVRNGDAGLSNLEANSGTINPAFDTFTQTYTATVPYTTTSVKITPTTSATGATITVNGKAVKSGVASTNIALATGTNIITTIVSAPDHSITTYTLTITRELPANADLTIIHITGGTISPAFNRDTLNYTVTVANSVQSMTATPVITDPLATVTINGAPVLSKAVSDPILLTPGVNYITAIVNAQDGHTTKTYTIKVTRTVLPSDASLLSLVPSAGTLNTAFDTGTFSYTVDVPYTTTSFKVTPTVNDAKATITINGKAVKSGVASATIPLVTGDNAITTVVTAQDGSTATYTITVKKKANADLTIIHITGGTISPAFNRDTLNYTVTVANSVKSMTASPVLSDPLATVTINGAPVLSKAVSDNISLAPGLNTITAIVTAQDGRTTKTYTIAVTRTVLPSDASLLSLVPSAGTLNTAFNAGTFNYTLDVPYATTSFKVTPTVNDAKATITVNGKAVKSGAVSATLPLVTGNNAITTVVTAQDGSTATYTITVNKKANADLTIIHITHGTISPAFNRDTLNYTVSVANSVTSMTASPVLSDPLATVTINDMPILSKAVSGDIPLTVGTNTITAVVTAQDGVTTKTYTITVTRAAGALSRNSLTSSDASSSMVQDVVVHTAVSPNGDGVNDVLKIDNIEAYPDNQLMIANSNGAKVFEASGYNNTSAVFNGHSTNGALLPEGTYYYVLQYHVNSTLKTKSGYFVLKF